MLMSASQSRWQRKFALLLLKMIKKHTGFSVKTNFTIIMLHMVFCVPITSTGFFQQKVLMSKDMFILRL